MRFAKRKVRRPGASAADRLKIGFVPTIDCATLIAAHELGLFRARGLNVQIVREIGWATIREKLLHEELDAAAAHASMLFSIYCGIGVLRRPCLTGLMMGTNGSAITLSNELWELGARDAKTTGEIIRQLRGTRTFTFGVVLNFSTQHHNLRQWLMSAGVDPVRDVRIVIVSSALMYDSFHRRHLDGYCVAEPWNSMAVTHGTGWVVATTCELSQQQPEKVLLVLQDFAERRDDEHIQLIAAMAEASRFCDEPGNRAELAHLLAQPRYFDVDASLLARCLTGPFDTGRGTRHIPDFITFDAFAVGAPDRARGRRVFDLVREIGTDETLAALRPDVISKVFRPDIYERALALLDLVPDDPAQTGLVAPADASGCLSVPTASWTHFARSGRTHFRESRRPIAGLATHSEKTEPSHHD